MRAGAVPSARETESPLLDTLVSLTLPIFIVIAFGFVAGKRGAVPVDAIPALNTFVFSFAMPALIVRVLAGQPVDSLLEPAFFISWLVAGLGLFIFAAALTRLFFQETPAGMAISGQGAAVANVGFLGLPLVLEAFGPEAAAPFTLALVVDLVILIPLSIFILETRRVDGGKTRPVAVLKGTLVNPFLLSIVGGLGLALTETTIPAPVDRTMAFLGGAAGPTALFALGLSLADRRVEGELRPIGVIVALKLIAHPLLLCALMLSFGVEGTIFAAGLTLAALPVANNVFVIATRYGVHLRRTSAAILISTILAVLTVTLAIEIGTGLVGR